MTGKTLADHSRAYRTRKAKRIARMEAALREIQELEVRDVHNGYEQDGTFIWEECIRLEDVRRIASEALAKPTNT